MGFGVKGFGNSRVVSRPFWNKGFGRVGFWVSGLGSGLRPRDSVFRVSLLWPGLQVVINLLYSGIQTKLGRYTATCTAIERRNR